MNNDEQFGGTGNALYPTFSGQSADANTILIKHAHVNQVGARSNAGVVCCITAGGCATPCRYAGYAGSVAISIAAAFAAAEID